MNVLLAKDTKSDGTLTLHRYNDEYEMKTNFNIASNIWNCSGDAEKVLNHCNKLINDFTIDIQKLDDKIKEHPGDELYQEIKEAFTDYVEWLKTCIKIIQNQL